MSQAAAPNPGLTLGEKILILRKRRGWTLEQLGEQVGLPASTLSRYERGRDPQTKAVSGGDYLLDKPMP